MLLLLFFGRFFRNDRGCRRLTFFYAFERIPGETRQFELLAHGDRFLRAGIRALAAIHAAVQIESTGKSLIRDLLYLYRFGRTVTDTHHAADTTFGVEYRPAAEVLRKGKPFRRIKDGSGLT